MRRSPFGNRGSMDETETDAHFSDWTLLFGIWKNGWQKFFCIFWSIASGAIGIVQNIVMGLMMDDMMNSLAKSSLMLVAPDLCNGSVPPEYQPYCDAKDFDDVIVDMILKMFYCILASNIAMFINLSVRVSSMSTVMVNLRHALYGTLMNADIEYFDQQQTGVLVSRLSEDCTLLRSTYYDKFFVIVQNVAQGIANLIIAFCYNWRVTLVCLPIIPLSGVVFWVCECFIDKLWVEYNESATAAADKAEEIITSFRIVKSFDREMDEADKYQKQLQDVNRIYKKTSVVDGAKGGIISFLVQGMQAIIMYYSFWIMVRHPEWGVTTGDMMISMMSVMNITMAVTQLLVVYTEFRKAGISAVKVNEILRQKPKVDRKVGNTMENVKGKIEFRDVCFKYKGRDDYAVQHLSFVIEAGQTAAFVGESGCGKSTTLQLIQRFYEIESGQILLDDVDITTLSQVFLRSQISIVPQGPVLFSMSIMDNIRYAKPNATKEEVSSAARIGNAHDFVMELPQNYETVVEQTSLSGGQKQRICISRSIVQSTPILLLDEATAALDTESEQLVQQSIETYRHGKTAIMVAHRLATVKHADVIFVFKDGAIAEKGTFDDLIKQNGIFADLVKYQLQ